MNATFNIYFYPTTIAIIDDNASFLSNIRLMVANSIPTILFDSPKDALEYLNYNNVNLDRENETLTILHDEEFSTSSSRIVRMNIANNYKRLFNSNRFSQVSTIIVDYQMPEIDGIQFCRDLHNHNLRRIMLTGKAGNDIAVEAFNAGIISKFLEKNNLEVVNKLKSSIIQEQSIHFQTINKPILDSLQKDSRCFIHQNEYWELFSKVYQECNACEYYLLDLTGSIVFLDMDANPTYLFVKSEDEMDKYTHIAEDSELPSVVISCLKNREKLLFLLDEEDLNSTPDMWVDRLYNATQLSNTELYYSIISDDKINLIDMSNVLSFREYLRAL